MFKQGKNLKSAISDASYDVDMAFRYNLLTSQGDCTFSKYFLQCSSD